jgi:hypothetical protein
MKLEISRKRGGGAPKGTAGSGRGSGNLSETSRAFLLSYFQACKGVASSDVNFRMLP